MLLESVARVRKHDTFKLVLLAGNIFEPFIEDARRLGIEDRIVVLGKMFRKSKTICKPLI